MMELLLALVIANIAVNVIGIIYAVSRIIDADYCSWIQHKELKEKIEDKKVVCICPICLKEHGKGAKPL